MSITAFIQNQHINPKLFIYTCLSALVLLSALHVFMLSVLFPSQADFMSLYIPSRSGGRYVEIAVDTFNVVNGIILAVVAVMAVVVAILVHRMSNRAAVALTVLTLIPSIVYVALYIGSAFHLLWGNIGATLGVLGIIVIGFTLELPLLVWMNQHLKKR
jgi:hypothetical protein